MLQTTGLSRWPFKSYPISLLVAHCLLSACSAGDVSRDDGFDATSAPPATLPVFDPTVPSTTASAAFTTVELEGLVPQNAKLVGVAVTPNGSLYVLEENTGLYRVDGGSSSLVFDTEDLGLRFGLEPSTLLTDVTATSDTVFAATAENDGYLLDISDGSLRSYFCYLPEVGVGPSDPPPAVMSVSQTFQLQGIAVKQRTESVGYQFSDGALFAQPQTIRVDTGEVVGSELFMFDASGGEPVNVVTMPDVSFIAGGMLPVGDEVLLGVGSLIYRVGIGSPPRVSTTLPPDVAITGMARAATGQVLLLDGENLQLLYLSDP